MPLANAVNAVAADHRAAPMRPIGITPKRSSTTPTGICDSAYDQKKTLKTSPICAASRPNSCCSCGAATDRAMRSK